MIPPPRSRITRAISGTISSMWCVMRISVVPVARDLADALHEGMARDEVEAGGRFVENEGARRGDERAREQHPPRLAARHLVEPAPRQVRDAHPLERLRRALPHLRRHRPVAQNPLRGEEPREHRGVRHHAPLVVAEDEAVMQIRRDDAELRSQLEHVPVVAAEDPYRGRAAVCASGRSSCVSSLTNADLPAPFGPRMAVCSSARMVSVRPSRTGRSSLDDGRVGELEDGRVIGKCKVQSGKLKVSSK